MDAIYMGWNRTTRRVAAGVISVTAAALLAGGTAAAAPSRDALDAAHQASHPVTSDYFGVDRTTTGFIPGL
jgi:hypothetical protein